MPSNMLALVDCNNFFVSCERLFRPDLEGRAVVVLSSNDGCVVARSNEAKAIGIPMGAPAFQYRKVFKQHNVQQFSTNFELYGNISRRIVTLLTSITPRTEIYSVDEAFLDLSELPINDYKQWGSVVRKQILRWVGVPVSIGIAPSKTLAKLATSIAKKDVSLGGVLDITSLSAPQLAANMRATNVEDVWGVGHRLAPRLRAHGIATTYQLTNTRPQLAQNIMGIHGRRLVSELNGVCCWAIEPLDKVCQSIARTRTFGEDTDNAAVIEAAISSFVAQAAYRLRQEGMFAKRAGLFLATNRHKPGYQQWRQEVVFNTASADTGLILGALANVLQAIYKTGQLYHRAGVWLSDFVSNKYLQTNLLNKNDITSSNKSAVRMSLVDQINARWGRQTIYFAAEGLGDQWQPKRHLCSPHYTSSWTELPLARLIDSGQSKVTPEI